jgi:hypothetical protein
MEAEMGSMTDVILPYRVEGQDLEKMVEHRARGRSLDQIRTLGFSEKGYEGTRRAAEALGLLDEEGELTELGKKFALEREAEGRRRFVLERMLEFEPYGLLLTSLLGDGTPDITELSEIELWWSTHGFGNSQSNRERGSTAFGRLVDYAGLGRYILGRGGHPSRIEWKSGAAQVVTSYESSLGPEGSEVDIDDEQQDDYLLKKEPSSEGRPDAATATLDRRAGEFEVQVPLSSLSAGRVARVIVPRDLNSREKERLVQALEFLLMVDDETGPDEQKPSTAEAEED